MPDGIHEYVLRPLVYVAGPYTSPDPVLNTNLTIQVAGRLIDQGAVTPVIPHLTLLWHAIQPRGIDFWYEYDLAVLARCDAVFRIPGASTGADKETSFAESRGIPVFNDEDLLNQWARNK